MRNVYAIGEIVTANHVYTGMITEIIIRKNSIVYRLQQTTEDDCTNRLFEDYEITSKSKKMTLIRECLQSNHTDSNIDKIEDIVDKENNDDEKI